MGRAFLAQHEGWAACMWRCQSAANRHFCLRDTFHRWWIWAQSHSQLPLCFLNSPTKSKFDWFKSGENLPFFCLQNNWMSHFVRDKRKQERISFWKYFHGENLPFYSFYSSSDGQWFVAISCVLHHRTIRIQLCTPWTRINSWNKWILPQYNAVKTYCTRAQWIWNKLRCTVRACASGAN